MVAFIYRDDYYKKGDDLPEEEKNVAELLIAKQRNGPTGTVKLAFMKEFTLFHDPFLG